MGVNLQNKIKPNNYSGPHLVNLAGIRRKDYVLIWGGLTDVQIFFLEAWSKASCEKSAEDIVPMRKYGEGPNLNKSRS
ncbi:MAG: hypothetical protein ACK5L5_03025, partial [Bacteroidales bacterium]